MVIIFLNPLPEFMLMNLSCITSRSCSNPCGVLTEVSRSGKRAPSVPRVFPESAVREPSLSWSLVPHLPLIQSARDYRKHNGVSPAREQQHSADHSWSHRWVWDSRKQVCGYFKLVLWWFRSFLCALSSLKQTIRICNVKEIKLCSQLSY